MAGERLKTAMGRYRERYAAGNRRERSGLLDEFCRQTGYHRKYAMALLRPGGPPRAAPGGGGAAARGGGGGGGGGVGFVRGVGRLASCLCGGAGGPPPRCGGGDEGGRGATVADE